MRTKYREIKPNDHGCNGNYNEDEPCNEDPCPGNFLRKQRKYFS